MTSLLADSKIDTSKVAEVALSAAEVTGGSYRSGLSRHLMSEHAAVLCLSILLVLGSPRNLRGSTGLGNASRIQTEELRADFAQVEAERQVQLGLQAGEKPACDYHKALKYFQAAAAMGSAKGSYYIGFCYDHGLGVSQDDAQALKYYTEAADKGYAAAQNSLGVMYGSGKGVPRDDVTAVQWYRMAAEQGDLNALNSLGGMYATGRGVPVNDAEAVKYFSRSAHGGFAQAQHNLGLRFYSGLGIARNDFEAARWFRAAAEQGFGPSQDVLGMLYKRGQGVPQDNVAAYVWRSLAARQGVDNIVARERLVLLMTEDQIVEAQSRVLSWKANPTWKPVWGIPIM